MTDQELMELMLRVDPQAQRIPPGIRAIVDAVAAEKQAQLDRCTKCVEQLNDRIATLEQQRQQDCVNLERYQWLRKYGNAFYNCTHYQGIDDVLDKNIDAERTKEPHD